jgi:phosphomannomutase
MKYIFDVDGTLTPSRQPIMPEFKDWFLDFCKHNEVYIVTGSDYPKTLEQLGEDIMFAVRKSYNCSGSDVYEKGKNIYKNHWYPPDELYEFLEGWLLKSPYPTKLGNHIEDRPGMVNFSIVGRNADLEQRKKYYEYDVKFEERRMIAEEINLNFNFEDITCTVAGETGVDIHPVGCDKSQILRDFREDIDFVRFFGDRCEAGGNDYPLLKALGEDKSYWVKDWMMTKELLTFQNFHIYSKYNTT